LIFEGISPIGNGNDINVGHRAIAGFFAGLLSTPFDTIANRTIKSAAQDLSNDNALQIGLRALGKIVINSVKNPAEFFKAVSMGALPRAFPSVVSAVVFSKEGGDAILEASRVIFNKSPKAIKSVPDLSVTKAVAQKARDDKKIDGQQS
jgi:hypothetical protein